MQRSVSENLFVSFFKSNRWVLLLLVPILLGALLIIISSNASGSVAAETNEEERIAAVVSEVDGVGRAEVMINMRDGEIISCAVVCTGGDSERVISEVKALISALYGIGYNRISVLKLSE